jgi:hypothetical protein
MEKTMVPLSEAYKIADRMARPWHWAAGVLATTVIGLIICLVLHHTASIDELKEAILAIGK